MLGVHRRPCAAHTAAGDNTHRPTRAGLALARRHRTHEPLLGLSRHECGHGEPLIRDLSGAGLPLRSTCCVKQIVARPPSARLTLPHVGPMTSCSRAPATAATMSRVRHGSQAAAMVCTISSASQRVLRAAKTETPCSALRRRASADPTTRLLQNGAGQPLRCSHQSRRRRYYASVYVFGCLQRHILRPFGLPHGTYTV